jgi:hypothetical protein
MTSGQFAGWKTAQCRDGPDLKISDALDIHQLFIWCEFSAFIVGFRTTEMQISLTECCLVPKRFK